MAGEWCVHLHTSRTSWKRCRATGSDVVLVEVQQGILMWLCPTHRELDVLDQDRWAYDRHGNRLARERSVRRKSHEDLVAERYEATFRVTPSEPWVEPSLDDLGGPLVLDGGSQA